MAAQGMLTTAEISEYHLFKPSLPPWRPCQSKIESPVDRFLGSIWATEAKSQSEEWRSGNVSTCTYLTFRRILITNRRMVLNLRVWEGDAWSGAWAVSPSHTSPGNGKAGSRGL